MPRQNASNGTNGTRTQQLAIADGLEIAEIDELMLRTDAVKRAAWAQLHAQRIATLLDTPCLADVPQRIWRLRIWQDDDYIVMSMTQNINVPAPNPQTWIPKIVGMVFRPYHRGMALAHSATAMVRIELGSFYSADELVAFYRLDTVDPDTVDWTDDTRYSTIALPVGNVLGHLRRTDD